MLAIIMAVIAFQSQPNTVTVPHCPDLGIVQVIQDPAEIPCTGQVRFKAIVGNIGQGAADSSSVVFAIPMTQIVEVVNIGPLAPGAQVETEWVNMTLPAGEHILVACADARQVIAEADESNNCTLRNMQTMGAYDIRYSTDPEAAWEDMTPIPDPPKPLPDGFRESTTITGLDPGTTYYFRMKVCNEAGWSEESNVATGRTEVQE